MKAEIIAVGTEILLGQIVNTNATYLSEFLSHLGFDLYHQQVVGDNEGRLLASLEEASKRADLVVVCGGLGPTEDDLTKQTTAKFLGKELMYDKEAMERLEVFFQHSKRGVTENNKRQALTIEGSTTLQNPAGLACGLLAEHKGVYYLLLPGPPREMKAVAKEGLPLLKELLPNETRLDSTYLRFMGIGESFLAEKLDDLIRHQTNPTLATYAKSNEVMLRITAKSTTEKEARLALDSMEQLVMNEVGEFFYGYGEELTIEEVVVDLLKQEKATLSVVEGVSGGLCQGRLTDIKGSSQVFKGGLVAYSLETKRQLLEFAKEDQQAAEVLNQVQVESLAKAIRQVMKTDYGLAMIGVGGPDKVDDKEVGSVLLSVSSKERTISHELVIKRERDYIKDGAVKHGLNLLRKEIMK